MSNQYLPRISTEEIHSLMTDGNELIVDTRPIASYNGWRLQNEKREGHIPGAISFPFEWAQYEFELPEFLQAKKITQEKAITFYDTVPERSDSLAQMLLGSGFKNIKVYNDFLDEWSENQDLPLEKLFHYKKLVYPQWVHEVIKGGRPYSFGGNPVVICHAHYDNYEDYNEGHIPTAIALDTLELESPDTWNRRSPEELEAALLKHGITKDTTVILYGRFSYPHNEDPFPGKRAGQIAAMRCAAIMMYAGVQDVRILNGSILAWEKAGYSLSKKANDPVTKNKFGTVIPAHPEFFIDMDQARKLLSSVDGDLVSVRSWEEYTGRVSGYHYIDKSGRIPGAIFGNCGSDAYHMENYRNPDLTMRAANEVKAGWAETGIVPEKHIAFYCGTGWRGSEAFLNAYLMGWPRVSVYDGGWMEWSSHPENPVASGEPDS